MKRIESLRNKRITGYIFVSQVYFLFFVGFLLIRQGNTPAVNQLVVYRNTGLMFVPLAALILAKYLSREWYRQRAFLMDFIFNLIYMIITVYLLINEQDSLYKFLLLMPVVVSSLQYGARMGFVWSALASAGILIADMYRTFQVDLNILVIGTIWLLAWLLGKMSEMEKAFREDLQLQAALDGMTGVYNHRSFHSLLEEAFNKAGQENSELTLVMVDVDFFKYYNDAYGHHKGDEVLGQVAAVIKNEAAAPALCARYGGDEFAVILPGTGSALGLEMGERIKDVIAQTDFAGAEILPGGRLTVSVGVASFPENAASREQLIQRAEEALYKAKYTNSNKVELYYSVFDEIGRTLQDKEKDLLNSMRTLLMVINAKDRYTYGHSERVMHYAVQIGQRMALWEWEIQILSMGALLHDIGKIEVSREILNKPGKLDGKEWEFIRKHPIWGADMIRPISAMSEVVNVVLHHHENYDGSGYPAALKQEEIPLGARILRLADSFDAMTSTRPYKKVMSLKEAVKDLEKYRGIHYDPEVFDAFYDYISATGILSNKVKIHSEEVSDSA